MSVWDLDVPSFISNARTSWKSLTWPGYWPAAPETCCACFPFCRCPVKRYFLGGGGLLAWLCFHPYSWAGKGFWGTKEKRLGTPPGNSPESRCSRIIPRHPRKRAACVPGQLGKYPLLRGSSRTQSGAWWSKVEGRGGGLGGNSQGGQEAPLDLCPLTAHFLVPGEARGWGAASRPTSLFSRLSAPPGAPIYPKWVGGACFLPSPFRKSRWAPGGQGRAGWAGSVGFWCPDWVGGVPGTGGPDSGRAGVVGLIVLRPPRWMERPRGHLQTPQDTPHT